MAGFDIRVTTLAHFVRVIASSDDEGDAELITRALNAMNMQAIFDYWPQGITPTETGRD